MAISTSLGNPIIVTGTTATDTEVYNPGTGASIFIKFIYWYNPTTAGNLLSVKDENGRVIVPARCETDNESQWLPIWGSFDSIHIDDMDSGTVYIYTR